MVAIMTEVTRGHAERYDMEFERLGVVEQNVQKQGKPREERRQLILF